MKIKVIPAIFVILMVFSCTPEKNDSIYDYPDTYSKSDGDSATDSFVKDDTGVKPDDETPLPDNEENDDKLPDSETPDNNQPDNEYPDDPLIATCGNDQIDFGEVCEKNDQILCVELDPGSYSAGEAF